MPKLSNMLKKESQTILNDKQVGKTGPGHRREKFFPYYCGGFLYSGPDFKFYAEHRCCRSFFAGHSTDQ